MKRFLLYIIVLLLASCSVFNEKSEMALTEDKILTDSVALERNLVLAIYTKLGGSRSGEGLQGTDRGIYDLNTFTTNEAIIPTRGGDWYDSGIWQQLFTHTWDAGHEAVENAWNYLYEQIANTNRSIDLLEKYKNTISTPTYNRHLAELKCLRALFYYYLLDLFGNVPIVRSSTVDFADIAQSSRTDVFQFVVSELETNVQYLALQRSNHPGNYYGRITQPVVWFILAKLWLNAPIYTGTTDYQKVIDNTSKLTDFGYTLEKDYSACFSVHNEFSTENIFTIPMNSSLYSNLFTIQFRSLHYQHAAALGYSGENGPCATLETNEVFGYKTKSLDNRYALNFFYDTVYVESSQLLLSNGKPLVYYPLEVDLDLTGSEYMITAGARMNKYAYDPTALSDGKLRENDIVLFRYADALLMQAEAKVRMGLSGQDELDEITNRAGMPSCQATLENIYRERWRELMWEGWHRQDMIRFNLYQQPYACHQETDFEADQHTNIFPIPAPVITSTKLTQNKGY